MRAAKVIKRCLAFCFLAVSAAGLSGCGTAGAVAESGERTANYPEVWERVLPEAMHTNIANFTNFEEGMPRLFGEKKADVADYGVSANWTLEEVYHVDGVTYDDVILHFRSRWEVLYYSFFGGHLLSGKNGRYRFPNTSDIYDVVSVDSTVHKLAFTHPRLSTVSVEDFEREITRYYPVPEKDPSGYILYPARITLSSGMIYDESYLIGNSAGYLCHDPPIGGNELSFSSHGRGVHFLAPGYTEEDTVLEKSWLLLQGFEEPRTVSQICVWGAGSLHPSYFYNYYEYSFLRTEDYVVPLADGTFLFIGTSNEFPVFHIVRMHSDMSIPAELADRYKWVSYEDYVGILSLNTSWHDFPGHDGLCPLLNASHPYCIAEREDGYCSEMKGRYMYNDRYADEVTDVEEATDYHPALACLDLALRDYVRGGFEVYHCREGEEMVAGFTPCDERTGE